MVRPSRDGFAVWLLIMCGLTIAAAVLCAKWSINLAGPNWSDGSQWHANLRYGTLRLYWGEPGTVWSGRPPGFTIEHLEQWMWQWGAYAAPTTSIGFIQLPLWFPALLFLAWFIARKARRTMRLASGLCPFCGQTIGSADRCPKCKRIAPLRSAQHLPG